MSVPKLAISAERVSKEYRLFSNKGNKLIELILKKNQRTIMRALTNISFTLEQGECLGLVGLNGSGKSTLANIISGTVQPTYGKMQVIGESSCISVSVGLNNSLTGIENIEYKGLLLGFSPEKIKAITPKIIEFADIGNYINQPVKYYSSGMVARLGFAISINIDPDILVIDEGLSVGDPSFTEKCLNAMNEYRARGKTVVFVSHSVSTIMSFCTKAMWLEYGQINTYGNSHDVCAAHQDFMVVYNKMSSDERVAYKEKQISAYLTGKA